jgi:hypothetical protein
MSTTPNPASPQLRFIRRKRLITGCGLIALLGVIVFVVGAIFLSGEQQRIDTAVKASFPNLCGNGEVVARLFIPPLWEVSCTGNNSFVGPIMTVNVFTCQITRGGFVSFTPEAANFFPVTKDGKMPVCP